MKTRNITMKKILLCSIVVIFLGSFVGCGNMNPNLDSITSEQKNNDEMNLAFSVEDYQKKMRNNRILISEYREQYQKDIDEVQKIEYQNMKFSDCKFSEFPEAKSLKIMVAQDHGITVQESWNTIEKWLEEIGKSDKIDMKSDVRVVSPGLGMDENKEYPYCYKSFYEYMPELNTGSGAFVDTNICHIQILSDGIYSMSDGKMTEYLGLDSKAAHDALGSNSENNIVEKGKIYELEDKEYDLITGKMSVQKGAELVKDFFLSGTPFPCEGGVTVDIPEVAIFKLGDVYGYDYMVRRVYNDVPFAYMDVGSYQYDGDYYSPESDSKHAYVVDYSGVTAFCGNSEAEKLIALVSDEKLIGLGQAVDMIEENFAARLDIQVKTMGLVYFPIVFCSSENPEERIVIPTWELTGVNGVKEENIRIYVDAFTGEIYYYTFRGFE